MLFQTCFFWPSLIIYTSLGYGWQFHFEKPLKNKYYCAILKLPLKQDFSKCTLIFQYNQCVTFIRFSLMMSSVFWNISPCHPLKVNRRFVRTSRFHIQDRRISQARCQRVCHLFSWLVYFSTLKMEPTYSSETSADFQRTTLRYIQ
jgi:hypothetical protein